MKIDNQYSESINIKRGVRQGCVFSPDLFNFYSGKIMSELDGSPGFIIGGHNINNLRFADDAILIASSKKKLQQLLNKVNDESKKKGLSINHKKTECMVISKGVSPRCELFLDEVKIKQVESFIYLGSVINGKAKCDEEIKRRIGMAKNAFQKLGKILRNRKVSIETKMRIINCYLVSILTYGSECWTISATMEKRLESCEMWFLRRMLRISFTEHTSDEKVLERCNAERTLVKTIRKRQMGFLGHIMRKEGLENLTLTGKVQGNRSCGRQRETYMSSLGGWIKVQLKDEREVKDIVLTTLAATRDRVLWRAMIANVLNGQGT